MIHDSQDVNNGHLELKHERTCIIYIYLVFNRQYSHSIHYSKLLIFSDHEQYITNKFIDVYKKHK